MTNVSRSSAHLSLRAAYVKTLRIARVCRRGWNPPFEGDDFLCGTMRSLVEMHGMRRVVETGTYMGSSTAAFKHFTPEVHSIERSRAYHLLARWRLRNVAGIRLYRGHSPAVLSRLLATLPASERTLFFLDAHWDDYNPLLDELTLLKEFGWKPAIAIHDFQVPNHPELGYDTYPRQGIVYDFNYVRAHLDAIYGADGYESWYNDKAEGEKRGCLFVVPRSWHSQAPHVA